MKSQVQKPVSAEIQAKFNQGMALHQQGNLADAERIYREVLRQQPNHFGALHLLGVIAIETGHPEQGADLIRGAIGLNANIAAAHSNLGKALLDLNHPQEALASFDEAIALNPDFAIAHNNRGKALLDLKRAEDALASFDRALGLKRDDPQAWSNLAYALNALCRWKEAEIASRKAVALKPNFSEAWTNLADALNELERWDEAVVACRSAVALKPDDIGAWNSLGYALIALCRWNEAVEACRKAVALKPDNSDAWTYLGRALSAQKRLVEAAEAGQRAAALKPDLRGQSDLGQTNGHKLHEAVNRLVTDARTHGATFTLEVEQIRALHRIAMHDLWPNPGEYRKRSIGIGTSPRVPPNWRDVPTLMEDMCRYVNLNWTVRDAIHLSAFVLWYLNWIHPFGDGNGRIARAVCNMILYIRTASPLLATKSFVETLVENHTVNAEYITCLIQAHDTYSQTQNFDQATRHVEQWLSRYWEE